MGTRLVKLLEGWRGVWLLPFIHVLAEMGEASIRELAGALGVRSVVAKSAVYALRRLGLVEKVEGEPVKFKLVEGVADEYRRFARRVVLSGDYACFTGSHYIYASLKRSRVSAWVLPAYIVERVVEAHRAEPGLRPAELGRKLGLHGRTVSRALRVARLLGVLGAELVED